ncbi:MAG TPA: histidine kinase [Parafilimonas sp.]|nr:histidine kinase [Parafilimonas sp.]
MLFIICFIAVATFNCIIELFFCLALRPYHCPDCDTVTLREKISIVCATGINVATILGLIALGVKFTKSWYLQQAGNRMLARQKITSELKLLKARIQPDFLFESLQALYKKISTNRNQAAEMLLKFSELLSYMLYECNTDFVPVQRELFIINEFIALENMIRQKQIIFTENIADGLSGKYIPSFIVLSFIQNCVICFYKSKHKEAHFDITLYGKNEMLYGVMEIQPVSANDVKNTYAPITNTYINRLDVFYKNNYTLGFAEEENGRFIITMSLLLSDGFPKAKIDNVTEAVYAYTHV